MRKIEVEVEMIREMTLDRLMNKMCKQAAADHQLQSRVSFSPQVHVHGHLYHGHVTFSVFFLFDFENVFSNLILQISFSKSDFQIKFAAIFPLE